MDQQPPKSTVLITGGTGLIGSALTQLLVEKGYKVIVLSRRRVNETVDKPMKKDSDENRDRTLNPDIETRSWDPDRGTIDPEAIRQADFIVHLAGAGVADKRWSAKRKQEILNSRTHSCAVLVKALKELPNKVKAIVSASAIGWYGPDPFVPNPQPFAEDTTADDNFLGETCRLWETAIMPVSELGKRLVILRTGIVLSRKGGALAEFSKPVRMGMAAILGSGKQVISWIHIDDLCRLYLHAIEQPGWNGVYNAVAPHPVDNRTLTLELAKRLKGHYFVPVYIPSFILKMALGEMSVEVLKSATVASKKVRREGFQFLYLSIGEALENLLKKD